MLHKFHNFNNESMLDLNFELIINLNIKYSESMFAKISWF